jgi:hypothetical protein
MEMEDVEKQWPFLSIIHPAHVDYLRESLRCKWIR